jgi:hypothetical protein
MMQYVTFGVVQNQSRPLHQTTEACYVKHISLCVATGLEATPVATQLMTARRIGDVACQACWQTAQVTCPTIAWCD